MSGDERIIFATTPRENTTMTSLPLIEGSVMTSLSPYWRLLRPGLTGTQLWRHNSDVTLSAAILLVNQSLLSAWLTLSQIGRDVVLTQCCHSYDIVVHVRYSGLCSMYDSTWGIVRICTIILLLPDNSKLQIPPERPGYDNSTTNRATLCWRHTLWRHVLDKDWRMFSLTALPLLLRPGVPFENRTDKRSGKGIHSLIELHRQRHPHPNRRRRLRQHIRPLPRGQPRFADALYVLQG